MQDNYNLSLITSNPYLKSTNYADSLGLYRPDTFQIGNSLAGQQLSPASNPSSSGIDTTYNLMKVLYQYKLYETILSKHNTTHKRHSGKNNEDTEDVSDDTDDSNNDKDVSKSEETVSSQTSSEEKSGIDILLDQYKNMDHLGSAAEAVGAWGAYSLIKGNRTKPVVIKHNKISGKIQKIPEASVKDAFKSALTQREEALNKVVKAEEAFKKASRSGKTAAKEAFEAAKKEFNDINNNFQETLKISQKAALEGLSKYNKDIATLKKQLKGLSGKDAKDIINAEKEIARKAGNSRMLGLLNELSLTHNKELTEANISKALKTASKKASKDKSALEAAGKNIGKLTKAGKFLGKAGKFLGRAAIPLAIGLEALDVVSATQKDGGHFGKNAKKQVVKSTMGLGASIASGALVGTCVGGPIGTIAGIAVGTGMYFLGSWGGGKIGDEIWGKA